MGLLEAVTQNSTEEYLQASMTVQFFERLGKALSPLARAARMRCRARENYRFKPINRRLCLFVAIANEKDYNM